MFLGFNKNFNYKKNSNLLKEEFLKPGEQTQKIFSDILYPLRYVGVPKTEDDLLKICKFIQNNVQKKCEDTNKKFQRTAKEIWISKYSEGCSDYAIVFESIARQLRIPTIHLQMIASDWKTTRKNNLIETHHACECFINNKWIFVDPTLNEIIPNYNPAMLSIYSQKALCNFNIYAKCTDLFETKIHNEKENNSLILKLFGIKNKSSIQ